MLQFKIPEKQYILSLDSLDLNFLSQYVQKPNDEERVLWSKSVQEDPAFYQVEIVSEELQDGDAFIEPYESYLCYICNIDVPKKYYKQHNKSARHQNHKKFVEKVLENVGKQISIDVDSVPNNQEYDMFYCETCCKVVARNNKRNHKKSNFHIQSIENEQFTSKFIEMYINKKNNEDDIQSEINYENDLNSEFSSPSDSDRFDSNDSIHKYINNSRNNNVLNESNKCNGIEEVENFEKYLKEMIAKYNFDVKLPSVEGDSVVIVTPKGYKEHITLDAFHSYKKLNGFAFCLLCQKWVQENIPEHSASEEHVRNIFQPVNDNFAREVVNDKQYSHCLICNERVLTTSNHVNIRPKHNKYLQLSVQKSNECDMSQFSDVKNSSISNEKPSGSNLSKSVIDSSLSRVNANTGTVEEKMNEYRKQFSIVNASQLKCLVCPNSTVPYVNNNIITHVEGKLHRQAGANLFLKNSEIPSGSNLSKSVIDSSLSHINAYTGTVEEKLNEYRKQFSIVNASQLKCLVCPNTIVPYVDSNIITHVEGKPHRKAHANLLLKNSLKQMSLSVYYCNLCDQFIDDFLIHIKSHVEHKPIKVNGRKDQFKKYVYEDPLNLSPIAIAFRKKYKVLLQQNQIIRISDTCFNCKVCSIRVTKISEIDHMFGERHRLAMSLASNAS